MMKILVVGFCKTGTKSVEMALKMLGYNVADYVKMDLEHFEIWKRFFAGKGTVDDLHMMYSDVDAASDMPIDMFWEDCLKAFPNLKLILMTRDEDDWLRSWNKHWAAKNAGPLCTRLAFFSPTARRWIKFAHLEAKRFFDAPPQAFGHLYEGISNDVLRKVYRQHNENILQNAPPKQLLHFDFRTGWEPLCKFLGNPVPDCKFPHVNSDAGLLDHQLRHHPVFLQMYREMYIAWFAIACFLIFVLCLLLYILLFQRI